MKRIERVHRLLTARRDNLKILCANISSDAVTDNSIDCEVIHDMNHELMILDDILALMTNEQYLTEKEAIYNL